MFRVFKSQRSLQALLCMVLLSLMLASFTLQISQLHALSSRPIEPVAAARSAIVAGGNVDTARLFGEGAALHQSIAINARLLASFVQSQAEQSVALIAVENSPPRRVRVGEEVAPGLRLLQVEARRVFLLWNEQRVALTLHAPLSTLGHHPGLGQ